MTITVVASNTTVSDPACGRQLGHASWGVSVAGIILSIITVIIVAAVLATATSSAVSAASSGTGSSSSSCYPYHYVDGTCYKYRAYIGSSSYYSCPGRVSGSYCYYNNKI